MGLFKKKNYISTEELANEFFQAFLVRVENTDILPTWTKIFQKHGIRADKPDITNAIFLSELLSFDNNPETRDNKELISHIVDARLHGLTITDEQKSVFKSEYLRTNSEMIAIKRSEDVTKLVAYLLDAVEYRGDIDAELTRDVSLLVATCLKTSALGYLLDYMAKNDIYYRAN